MTYMKDCPACGRFCHQDLLEIRQEYSIYRCANCTVHWSSPMISSPDEPRIKGKYKTRTEYVGQYLGFSQYEFANYIADRKLSILDIGCGTGDFVALANNKGHNAIGIDLDTEAIQVGISHWRTNKLLPVDIDDYFGCNSNLTFDAITLFGVIEHVEEPSVLITKVKDHLYDRGLVCLSTQNTNSPLNKLWGKVTDIDYPPHHLTRWNPNSMAIFLKTHGFKVTYCKTSQVSVYDIISDIFTLYLPPIYGKLLFPLGVLLKPIEFIARAFVKEGRSLVVIAVKGSEETAKSLSAQSNIS